MVRFVAVQQNGDSRRAARKSIPIAFKGSTAPRSSLLYYNRTIDGAISWMGGQDKKNTATATWFIESTHKSHRVPKRANERIVSYLKKTNQRSNSFNCVFHNTLHSHSLSFSLSHILSISLNIYTSIYIYEILFGQLKSFITHSYSITSSLSSISTTANKSMYIFRANASHKHWIEFTWWTVLSI